jgi:hypothetical protein
LAFWGENEHIPFIKYTHARVDQSGYTRYQIHSDNRFRNNHHTYGYPKYAAECPIV